MNDIFESAANFSDDLIIEYLIDDVIEKNTTGVIFGESTAGKSFIAVDLGLSVAVGVQIFNNKLAEKGLVLYVAGEGYVGLRRRVKAWRINYGIAKENTKLFFLSKKTISFNGSGVSDVIKNGEELQKSYDASIALLIVDTLAQHMEGDENSTSDMSRFIKTLGTLQSSFPGSVLIIVHHTGHNELKRARGSSSLKAAMDFEIQIKKGGKKNTGVISFTKMKDSEIPDDIGFTLVPVDIGFDRKGGPITSCIVEYGECSKSELHDYPTDTETIALDALINVCVKECSSIDGLYYGSHNGWRKEFYKLRQMVSEKIVDQDTLKRAFQRACGKNNCKGLNGKMIISITEHGVLPLREKDQAKIAYEINRVMQTEHGT